MIMVVEWMEEKKKMKRNGSHDLNLPHHTKHICNPVQLHMLIIIYSTNLFKLSNNKCIMLLWLGMELPAALNWVNVVERVAIPRLARPEMFSISNLDVSLKFFFYLPEKCLTIRKREWITDQYGHGHLMFFVFLLCTFYRFCGTSHSIVWIPSSTPFTLLRGKKQIFWQIWKWCSH